MRTLVLGQAASGKSEYAEKLAVQHGGALFYIATMQPFGKEATARILRHQKLRAGKCFATREQYTALASLHLAGACTVLLECLGNLAANELFASGQTPNEAETAILQGMDSLERQCENLVVVSNDVAFTGEVYSPETVSYLNLLCRVNAALASRFERVAEVVCSIPIWHKGEEQ